VNGGIPVVIRGIEEKAPGIKEFRLARSDGGELPAFAGGSHILVALPVHGKSHLNAYSLMGDPAETDAYRIAVRRMPESRGGSHFLHDQARPGQALAISHPVNLFSLARLGRKHLLVAGGIGVTPILAQARQLKRLGARFEVHYAYREPAQAAYAAQLKELAGDGAHFYCDSEGRFMDFKAMLSGQPLGTHVYVCGPEGLRESLFEAGRKLGWPASHLHYEQFVHALKGKPFRTVLKRSGKELTVSPDTSLLEAIEQAGVEAPYLCRGGACGQCETEVLEFDGELKHHDVYLSAQDKAGGRKIMPCVSRLDGKCLVLNL
jgi:ferredoxin-NADP reductase